MLVTNAIRIFGLDNDTTFMSVYKPHSEFDKLTINIVAITGGPCGGKTDLVNTLLKQARFLNGTMVFVASEAAEYLIKNNITYDSAGSDETFQRIIIERQLSDEKNVVISAIKYKVNHPYDTVFCIFDRSLMDGQAYFENAKDYTKILAQYGLTPNKIYKRIDRVVYMQSAANGAESYYVINGIRKEPLEKAKKFDNKVYTAWVNHPDFVPIFNSDFIGGFKEKLNKACGAIFGLVGKDMLGRYEVTFAVKKEKTLSLFTASPISTVHSVSVFLEFPEDFEPAKDAKIEIIKARNDQEKDLYLITYYKPIPDIRYPNDFFCEGSCPIVRSITPEEMQEKMSLAIRMTPVFEKDTSLYVSKDFSVAFSTYEGMEDTAVINLYLNDSTGYSKFSDSFPSSCIIENYDVRDNLNEYYVIKKFLPERLSQSDEN